MSRRKQEALKPVTEHLQQYIAERKSEVPLQISRRTLRSAMLESTNFRHFFYGDADWAAKVKQTNEAAQAKVSA